MKRVSTNPRDYKIEIRVVTSDTIGVSLKLARKVCLRGNIEEVLLVHCGSADDDKEVFRLLQEKAEVTSKDCPWPLIVNFIPVGMQKSFAVYEH